MASNKTLQAISEASQLSRLRDIVSGALDIGECMFVIATLGSYDRVCALLKQLPMDDEGQHGGVAEMEKSLTGLLDACLGGLGKTDAWKELARSDPKEYRRRVDAYLSLIGVILNQLCEVPSHRPTRNEERDALILAIKTEKPQRSFGQVAKEYERRTKKTMTSKNAERIYKRSCERGIEAELLKRRPDFAYQSMLKRYETEILPRIQVE